MERHARFVRLRRKENPSSVYYVLILRDRSLARESFRWLDGRALSRFPAQLQNRSYGTKDNPPVTISPTVSDLSPRCLPFFLSSLTYPCTLRVHIYRTVYIHIGLYKKSSRLWQRLWPASTYETAVSSLRDFSRVWAWSRTARYSPFQWWSIIFNWRTSGDRDFKERSGWHGFF